jgi:sugar phosphate isomerase/epimerase
MSKESGMRKNRFAVCEWSLPCAGVEAIQMAAGIGFDGIQLADMGGAGNGFPLASDEALQNAYRKTSAEFGIVFHSIHPYQLLREGTMIYPKNTPQGERAMTSLRAAIRACRLLGVDELSVTSGFGCEIKDEEGFLLFADMLNFACDEAESCGVHVAFESILPVAQIRRMREATKGRMRICYDTYNMLRFKKGDPRADLQSLAADDIDHFHLKDAPADNVGCALLGTGCGYFEEVVRLIQEMG